MARWDIIFVFLLRFAGDKKRAERTQLSSADGDTGETHDQFYRDHKLLLVLFRALAVMPITRSSPGQWLEFVLAKPKTINQSYFSEKKNRLNFE